MYFACNSVGQTFRSTVGLGVNNVGIFLEILDVMIAKYT